MGLSKIYIYIYTHPHLQSILYNKTENSSTGPGDNYFLIHFPYSYNDDRSDFIANSHGYSH